MAQERYIIATDTGGTFTDAVVMTEKGEIYRDKALTTPKDFSFGVVKAISSVGQVMGLSLGELLANSMMIKHGTTVATNALINRTGSKVGLITTAGLEDTTLIMRAMGRVAGLTEDEIKHQSTAIKPEPLVPRGQIIGVTERVDFAGKVVIPMSEAEAREAIKSLVDDKKVEAIAVNFIFGFVNPVHEDRIRELIREMYPDKPLLLSLASELVPVVREYARSNTVIINAFLDATMRSYIGNLGNKLRENGYKYQLLIMQANGGISSEEELIPVSTISSGPAGGMGASRHMADLLAHESVITTDMGGTSFDVGILTDGVWRFAREPIVERFHITWPMIDIESIGAGGGTIARVDPITRTLNVGPDSAGADPGPVCYSLGGTEPTVSDVDVVLGFLNPDYFWGGRMNLDKRGAEQAIKEKIADPLGITAMEAAAGIYSIVNAHMADLIRKKVIQTGRVPEECVIYSFGGAGAVHAAAYGSELGIKKVYVFPTSSVFSAFGITVSDVLHTHMISRRCKMPMDANELNEIFSSIEEILWKVLNREGFKKKDVEFLRTIYMRYRRQLNELDLRVPTKQYSAEDQRGIMDDFERHYEDVYGAGSGYAIAGMEAISFRVDGIGKTPKPLLKSYQEKGTDPSHATKGTRKVCFVSGDVQFIETNLYDYAKLDAGNHVNGPAIIEAPDTTIVIPSGCTSKVDIYRNVEIRLG